MLLTLSLSVRSAKLRSSPLYHPFFDVLGRAAGNLVALAAHEQNRRESTPPLHLRPKRLHSHGARYRSKPHILAAPFFLPDIPRAVADEGVRLRFREPLPELALCA